MTQSFNLSMDDPPPKITINPPGFGTIQNYQYKPLMKYIENLKAQTNWCEGEDILPQIPNYVMNFFLNIPFRLTDIVLHLPNSYYMPEEFAAPAVRILKTACLVFENGKLVITGACSLNNVKYAAYQHRRQLMQIQYLVKVLNEDGTLMTVTEDDLIQPDPNTSPVPPRTRPSVPKQVYTISTMEKLMDFKNFSLVNVVGSGIACVHAIDLSLLSNIMTTLKYDWDPEIFPGLKGKIRQKYVPMSVKKCTCYIFDSGAVIIMGATCNEDIINCFLFLKCIVKYFPDYQMGQTRVTNKYQYRVSQVTETTKLVEKMSMEENAELEKRIMEESSVRCFGNYIYEQEQREMAENPLSSASVFGSTTQLQKINPNPDGTMKKVIKIRSKPPCLDPSAQVFVRPTGTKRKRKDHLQPDTDQPKPAKRPRKKEKGPPITTGEIDEEAIDLFFQSVKN